MTKLFYEKGKRGSSDAWRRERRRMKDIDYSPPSGMKKVHSNHWDDGQKLNLSPLYRFLFSHVGRNWDEVYSEIKHNLKGKSSYYVLDWISYLVEMNVQIIDGVLFDSTGRFTVVSYPWNHRKTLYVCPLTNNLLVAPEYKRNETKRTQIDSYQRSKGNPIERMIDTSENIKYCSINGIWYEVQFDGVNYCNGEIYNTKQTKEFEIMAKEYEAKHNNDFGDGFARALRNSIFQKDGKREYRYQFDILSKDTIELKQFFNRYGTLGKPLSKRQLNKKEIKNLITNKHN